MTLKVTKKTHTQTDEYVSFIKSIQLVALGMDKADMFVDRKSMMSGIASERKTTVHLEGHHDIIKQGDQSFVVVYEFKTIIKYDDDIIYSSITCTFSALFNLDAMVNDNLIKKFSENEVRLIFWPYYRQFVSDSTYRMAINPVVLPISTNLPKNNQ